MKYAIVNKKGTKFNSFYCLPDKKGVFSNKCYSIFYTKKEAENRLNELRTSILDDDLFWYVEHYLKDAGTPKYYKNKLILNAIEMKAYWIKKFNECKVIEIE